MSVFPLSPHIALESGLSAHYEIVNRLIMPLLTESRQKKFSKWLLSEIFQTVWFLKESTTVATSVLS